MGAAIRPPGRFFLPPLLLAGLFLPWSPGAQPPGARLATTSPVTIRQDSPTNESLALAKNVTGPSPKSPILEVQYDPVRDQLSIRADQTSLWAVLQGIAQIARVSIDTPSETPEEQFLGEPLSAEMKDVSVEQALSQLLLGFNSAFLYSPAIDPQRGPTPVRLAKVIVLSRKASNQTVERDPGADPHLAVEPGAALVRSVVDKNSLSVKALVEALKAPARCTEREKAVEALLETLSDKNFPSHYDAIAALHQLAPAKRGGRLGECAPGRRPRTACDRGHRFGANRRRTGHPAISGRSDRERSAHPSGSG